MKIGKIIAAVDPFTDEPQISVERITRSILPFTRAAGGQVEIIYVLTPGGVSVPMERFAEYEEYYRLIALDALKSTRYGFAANVATRITVLSESSDSIRQGVETLLDYAVKEQADLIALTTHARKGVDRLFLGSFAESVMLRSPIPLLTTNPSVAPDPLPPAYGHILFTTDFEPGSMEVFETVIAVAKQLGAGVTLFHRLAPRTSLLPPPGLIAEQLWEEQKVKRQAKALGLKEQAEREGVPIEIDIDMENHRVTSAILAAIEKHQPSLLAIGTKARSLFQAMGSTPRQVLRAAPCPVLVLPVGLEEVKTRNTKARVPGLLD